MAKIYGVQLKAVQTHIASDGIATYANVYLNNKKVGTIHDDGVGAGMWANFISQEAQQELIEVARKFYEKYPTYVIHKERTDFGMVVDFLEDEVLLLHDLEKEFKANSKKGFPVTLYLQTHERNEDPFSDRESYDSPLIIGVKTWNEEMEIDIKKDYPKYKNISVYRDLSDFVIE